MAGRKTPLSSTFWLLWSGTLLNRLGDFVYPFLALYLTGPRGLSAALAGLVLALHGVGASCGGPVGGLLADRVGRRKTILIATSTGALAMLQLAVARSLPHLAFSALVLGFFNSLHRAPMQAAVADVVEPVARPRAYGLLYWANNLGFGFAALVGGLASSHGFFPLFVGDALTTLGFGALVYFYVPETRPAALGEEARGQSFLRSLAVPFRDPLMLTFLTFCLGTSLAFGQVGSTLPLVMRSHGIGASRYGELIALNGLLIVLLQLGAVPVAQRFPRSRVMALASLLIGLGFSVNAFARTSTTYAAGIVVWTLGEILMMPVASSLVIDLAPPQARGGYLGAYGLLFAVSLTLGLLSSAGASFCSTLERPHCGWDACCSARGAPLDTSSSADL